MLQLEHQNWIGNYFREQWFLQSWTWSRSPLYPFWCFLFFFLCVLSLLFLVCVAVLVGVVVLVALTFLVLVVVSVLDVLHGHWVWKLRPQDVRIDVYQHVGTCLLAAEPDSSSVAGMTLAIDQIDLMVVNGWGIWDYMSCWVVPLPSNSRKWRFLVYRNPAYQKDRVLGGEHMALPNIIFHLKWFDKYIDW